MAPAPTSPAPGTQAAQVGPTPVLPFGLDKRQLIGLGLGLLCIGVLIGFKIGSGGEPLVIERPVDRTVFKSAPCAECAERARENHPTGGPIDSVPGDSSVPED